MHIANVVLTIIEQSFNFPLVFHHESFIEQFVVDPESTVELDFDHRQWLELADSKR
jgi:hypothetical protein